MKKVIIFIIFCSFSLVSLFSVVVNENTAREVAEFHLRVRNVQTAFTISNSIALVGEGGTLAYIVNLEPTGFIAVSSDTDLTPIIAYSFKSSFYPDNEPRNVLFNMLKKDLESRKQAVGRGLIDTIQNNELWNRYINNDISYFNAQQFQKWPERGSVRTDGWVTTTWNQLEPFNNSCPIDPTTGRRSTLSTAAISLAQIINYYRYLGNASFASADGYTTLSGISIDGDNQTADFPSFNAMNSRLEAINRKYRDNTPLNNNDIASLCFAAAISVNTHFTATGAVTWTWDIAHTVRNKFNYRQASSYYADDDEFFSHLQTNARQRLPFILLFDANYEYAAICDGYNTAGEYHLNFGYANTNRDNYTLAWYSLPTYVSSDLNILSQAIAYIGRGIEALTSPAEEIVRIELDDEDLESDMFGFDEVEETVTGTSRDDAIQDVVTSALEGEGISAVGTTAQFVIFEEPPSPIRQTPPRYPRRLRRSGIEGQVVLRVEILETGEVGAIEVLKSLMEGEGGFDEAAIEAVRKWVFRPAQSGGNPIACWVNLPIDFRLN